MNAQTEQPRKISSKAKWTGIAIQAIVALFLAAGAISNLLMLPQAVEGAKQYGFPESSVFGTGLALLICVLLYVIPRTSIWGALFLTAYLGGAVATHVHASDPLVRILFPVLFAVLVWTSLALRNRRLFDLLTFAGQRSEA